MQLYKHAENAVGADFLLVRVILFCTPPPPPPCRDSLLGERQTEDMKVPVSRLGLGNA